MITVAELPHRTEDLAMRLAVKIVGAQDFERLVDTLIIEQNRAEDRLLGLEILRRNALQNVVRRCRRHLPPRFGPSHHRPTEGRDYAPARPSDASLQC